MQEQIAEFSRGERTSLAGTPWTRIAAAVEAAKERDGFVWILLDDPDGADVAELGEALHLHPLAIRDAASDRQQPKIQAYGDDLFVVLWALRGSTDSGSVAIAHLFMYIRAGLLLVVRRHAGDDGSDLGAIVEEGLRRLEHGVLAALYAVMSHVFEGYTAEIDRIEDALERLESQVFSERSSGSVERIYRLRQHIGRVQRAISGMTAALGFAQEHFGDLTIGHEQVDPYFRDLIDDVVGTNQLVTDQDRALDSVLASHQNNLSLRQNDDTRRISAIAAMLSVPAVIAGLYGMNFENLPGVKWEFGWLVVAAAVVVIDLVVFIVFKRRHWL